MIFDGDLQTNREEMDRGGGGTIQPRGPVMATVGDGRDGRWCNKLSSARAALPGYGNNSTAPDHRKPLCRGRLTDAVGNENSNRKSGGYTAPGM